MEELSLKKFEEAAEKVKEATLPTNLVYSEYFSAQSGNKVYLKPENMQYTGAYKVRGAYYKISQLSDEEKKKYIKMIEEKGYIIVVVYHVWSDRKIKEYMDRQNVHYKEMDLNNTFPKKILKKA